METPTEPIATARLRLSGRQLARIQDLLTSARLEKKAIIGVCGSTTRKGEAGADFVASVHALSEELSDLDKEPTDEILCWIAQKQKRYPLLPIVFHHGGEHEAAQARRVLETLSGDKCMTGIVVQVGAKGDMAGILVDNTEVMLLDSLIVAGPDILVWSRNSAADAEGDDISLRLEQSFGTKTTRMLSGLRVGVVGVSGTGSPVAEMLYRLGVKEITLVDDDCLEEKNLGRIYNSALADVGRFKVDVMGEAFERNGLPTAIRVISKNTFDQDVVRELAQCDIIFGCMDTHSGRNLLNRLCTFYVIPYLDLGVKLEADGRGGVSAVCGAVHYLQPDGSTLLSRKAISLAQIEAEDLKRTDPNRYDELRREKYIKGVQEDRPAVISVNTMVASIAVNDFLARLHPYRNNPNADIGSIAVNLREPLLRPDEEGDPDEGMAKSVGLGDIRPILAMPFFAHG